jgi:hypothetical protein
MSGLLEAMGSCRPLADSTRQSTERQRKNSMTFFGSVRLSVLSRKSARKRRSSNLKLDVAQFSSVQVPLCVFGLRRVVLGHAADLGTEQLGKLTLRE